MYQQKEQRLAGYQKGQEHQKKIAGAMGALLETTIPKTEDSNRFLRNISLPRDMEYLRLVARQMELLNRKEELLAVFIDENVPSEKQQEEMEAELQRLEEEISFIQKTLETILPESRRMQCMIYPEFREGQLILAGVIDGQGRPYRSGEELCKMAKPMTERERQQLLKGNRLLEAEWSEILNVEIYPEAVCVVYPDGRTRLY